MWSRVETAGQTATQWTPNTFGYVPPPTQTPPMPFLGRLASLLVVGDEQAQVVGFQMGGLVKLELKVDRDGFSVAWALPPDLA